MNNEENKLPENQENSYVDPRNVQAEVIGVLKNDKVGKPSFIVIFSVLLVGIMIALPYINSYINDEDGFIYKMLHPDAVQNNNNPYIPSGYADGSQIQILNETSKFKFDNIIISKCSVSSDTIKCMISSYNGIIDLDQSDYALEIYSNTKNLMGTIKLYGSYDFNEKEIELHDNKLNFNTSLSYYGKIITITEESIPDIELTTNEMGEQAITCRKDGEYILYTFKDYNLIRIQESLNIKNEDETKYNELLEKYQTKSNNLPNNASIMQYSDSFTYTLNVDLNNSMIPDEYKTTNYYELNTSAKKIHYSQSSKGYDCQ